MLAIIFGIVMAITHYLNDLFDIKLRGYYNKIISFSAGIAMTYIFLHLIPMFSEGVALISRLLFLSILLGFIIFYIVEKYIYQHSPKEKLFKELAVEDSITSFIYHFVVGIVSVSFVSKGIKEGILFFIPVLLYTSVSTLPVDITKSKIIKIIVSLSTLLGVLFVQFIYVNMSKKVYFMLLGFIIGTLLFTVTRHSIPWKKKGKPLFFIIGVLIYTLLIYLL